MHGYLLEFTLSMIENFIIIQIINYFLTIKIKKFQYIFIIVLSLIAQAINTMNIPYNLFYPIILLVIYVHFNYKENSTLKFVIAGSVFGINAYISYFIISTLEMFNIPVLSLLTHDTLLYVSLTFIAKFAMITLFFVFRNIIRKYLNLAQIINWKILLVEILVFFISVLYSFYIFVCEIVNAEVAMTLLIFQLIAFSITLYYFYKYTKVLKEQENIKFMFQGKLLYNSKSKEQSILYNHAYKEYCEISEKCLEAKKCLELKQYDKATTILADVKLDEQMTEFGNDALNFLINSKYDIMMYHDIQLQAIIGNSLYLLSADDLIYIIGNLLDCVIQELKEKKGANVKLEIIEVDAGIKLNIESNPISNINIMQKTVDMVKPIIEKYNGIIGSFMVDDMHIFKVVFFNNGGY